MQILVFRVKLEPVLETMAALWDARKRLEMAGLFESWAKQLRISVSVARADSPTPPPPQLSRLPSRRLKLN